MKALQKRVADATLIDLKLPYSIRATSLPIIPWEMSSGILAVALKAAMRRLLRRRMAEAAAIPQGTDSRLSDAMDRMAEATRIGTLRAVMESQTLSTDAA